MKDKKDLNRKQETFVKEYLVDMNGTKAAVRAGYSPSTARSIAAELLSKRAVADAIAEGMAERAERTKASSDWLLERLKEEVEADLADIYDSNNNLKPIDEWPLIWRQGLVAGVEVDAIYEGQGDDRRQIGETKKLRLSDRLRRLELIGKHSDVQAFRDRVGIDDPEDLSDRLGRAKARIAAQIIIIAKDAEDL